MTDEVEVLVGARRFTGWEAVEVQRSMEAASGSFSVRASGASPLPIRAGEEVEVRLAGSTVVKGHVDLVVARGDGRSRSLVVSGRDATADLVDCSEVSDPGEWLDVDLQRLVELIALPFDVEVRSLLEEETEVFGRFARQSGETAWSAIERACRLRGVLAHSSGDGALVLTRPARALADVALVEGTNVKSWAVQDNRRQRFQSYLVRAQHPGSDDYYADQSALVEATSADAGVERYRPLLVLAEGALTFESAQDRAGWEATVRAARSATVSCVVAGWRQRADGRVWDLNELSHVLLPGAGLDQVLLVNELRFALDREEGTTTEVSLTRRDAYDPQPDVDPGEDLEFGLEEGGF